MTTTIRCYIILLHSMSKYLLINVSGNITIVLPHFHIFTIQKYAENGNVANELNFTFIDFCITHFFKGKSIFVPKFEDVLHNYN